MIIEKAVVLAEYLDYTNIFLKELVAKNPKYLNIN